MNRLWIGIVILCVLLGMGLGIFGGSAAFFGALSREMTLCGDAAAGGDWALAAEKAEICREKWERWRYFWSAFTDHAPLEQVQLLFSQLELYENQRLGVEFAVCCRSLAKEAEAIRESHGLSWWSIL